MEVVLEFISNYTEQSYGLTLSMMTKTKSVETTQRWKYKVQISSLMRVRSDHQRVNY